MPNFLNLKKKDPSDIVYVEKIVLKNRTLSFELFRMLTIIAIASGIVWGISNADNLVKTIETPSPSKNFSAIGIVTEVSTTSITIGDTKASDQSSNTSYTFDTSNVKKIETSNYSQLTLVDILVGDKIIVQGVDNDGSIEIRRIISFGGGITIPTATTTEATTTATLLSSPDGSDNGGQATTSTTTNSSSTPSILENVSNTVSNVVGAIGDAAQNVIDTITGSSTATSTDETASTTVSTSTPVVNTTSSSSDTQPPVVIPATNTPSAVTPDTSSSNTAPEVVAPVVDTSAPTSEAPPAN